MMTAIDEPVRILLVDDLEENLIALSALLRREGLSCETASSGEEALELLLVKDYALAFLDVQMPGMDGFELAEFMRNSERSRHIPIIFVTAGAGDGTRRFKGYEAGAVDFIQKPIEADILRSKAKVFLELYNQRRQLAAQRDELAALTASLTQADSQKNRFLAVLGHELRNPIMALNAGLIMLERRKGQSVEDEIRTSMNRCLAHMTRLVDDLLDISRIEQGKISLQRERVDLNDVLAFAVETSRPAIDEAGHTLELGLPQGPCGWMRTMHVWRRSSAILSAMPPNTPPHQAKSVWSHGLRARPHLSRSPTMASASPMNSRVASSGYSSRRMS